MRKFIQTKSTNINELLTSAWIENYKKYIKDHPDSLIPLFEEELRGKGIEFQYSFQIKDYMPKMRSIIVPLALKYYLLAKEMHKSGEQREFLDYFRYKGIEEVVPVLLADYRSEDIDSATKWCISDCLYSIKSEKYLDDYLQIVSDPQNGINRQMIILLLGKLKKERAIGVIKSLLKDDTVLGHAIIALGCYKKEEFRSIFLKYIDSEKTYIRNCAKNAIKKLGSP